MKKYIVLFSSYLKQAMAYRADALMDVFLSVFQVVVCYLLWSMLVPVGGTLSGFTLPEMVTYSVLVTALSPFTTTSDPMMSFANEIRSGRFSRFLYVPISPFGVFVCHSLASQAPKCALTLSFGVVWGLVLSSVMSPIDIGLLLGALPLMALGVVFILLLNYLIACLAFRFTDILGVVFIRGTLISFFTGALAPLEVLFGAAPVWSPLYYLVGYPALLIMGRATVPMGTAMLVLFAFIVPMALLCLVVDRNSRRYYEGVGV